MENIHIYDNFFEASQFNSIDRYFKSIRFKCNSKVPLIQNKGETQDRSFWHVELSNIFLFFNTLKKYIEHKLNNKFEVLRVYAVAQTYGQLSNYHIDDNRENTYTFCYYFKNISFENDGCLFIKPPLNKHIVSIEPVSNRGVFFPSNYVHKGSCCNRFSRELRMCIVWKFKSI